MNPNASSCRTLAFTLVEMLVVIAIIGILAAILLPVLTKSEGRAKLIYCGNSQKQIGLAFHGFSNDHNGKFPMALSTNDGGSLEYVQAGFASVGFFYTSFRNFQPISNELVLAQTLVCPADTARTATNNFAVLQNQNLSYSVGVLSTFDKPTSMLAGDRNMYVFINDQPSIVYVGRPEDKAGWDRELHQNKGNVVFADGHVEEWADSGVGRFKIVPTVDPLFLPSVSGVQPIADGGPGPSGSAPGPGSSGPPSSSSGGPSSYPNTPAPDQSVSSTPEKPGMQPSLSSPSGSSPAGQAAPFNPFGDRISQTPTPSQARVLAVVKTEVTTQATDTVVSIQETNSTMSPFDNHMTMVMQNSLLWLYILLCILVLLYLLNKLRKKLTEKRDAQDRESEIS